MSARLRNRRGRGCSCSSSRGTGLSSAAQPGAPPPARPLAGAAPVRPACVQAGSACQAPLKQGTEAPGAGGMLEVWAGQPRREAPARPGLCVLPSTAPSPGAARFTAQETRALLPALPSPRRQRDRGQTVGVDWRTEAAAGSGQRSRAAELAWSRSRSSGPVKAPARLPVDRAGLPPPLSPDRGQSPPEGGHPAVSPGRTREPGREHPQDGEGSSFARQPGPRSACPAPPAPPTPAPKKAVREIKWWERCKAPWTG